MALGKVCAASSLAFDACKLASAVTCLRAILLHASYSVWCCSEVELLRLRVPPLAVGADPEGCLVTKPHLELLVGQPSPLLPGRGWAGAPEAIYGLCGSTGACLCFQLAAIPVGLTVCAALHEGGRVTLLFPCLLPCQCCFNLLVGLWLLRQCCSASAM
jgi:hypothetical protein